MSAIARYWETHHVEFVMCDDDGTELYPVAREHVALAAHQCVMAGRGYVKQVHTPKAGGQSVSLPVLT